MSEATNRLFRSAADQRRPRRRQQGASLIEVMVVLVILLIGIFLVIRIFPVGFGILQANGNRSIAIRLADNLMSGVNGDAANLPDGVTFAYQDTTANPPALKYATDIDSDRLTTFDPAGTNTQARENGVAYNPYFSDINRFRYIKGEGVKIPLPTVNSTTNFAAGSVYVCKFGPLYMDNTVGQPGNAPTDDASRNYYDTYLKVYGAPLSGIVLDSGTDVGIARGYFRSQQVYLIDYGEEGDEARIMFAPRVATSPARANPSRTFTIKFSYFNDSTGTTVSAETTVNVLDIDPATGVPAWQQIILPPALGGGAVSHMIPGSETVNREFDRLPIGGSWDTADPYQYKLASINIAGNSDVSIGDNWANMGVLLFNPAGANYAEANSGSTTPAFKAYLDYMVLDWHIIHEDREVPNALSGPANSVPLRTTLSFIKRSGDTESDGGLYSGLYGGANDNDIEVFDLNNPNGLALPQGVWNNGAPTPAGAAFWVDRSERGGTYRTGTIYINKNVLPTGSKIRILYKAIGDWGVALQKAYSSYKLKLDNTGNPAPFISQGDYDKFGTSAVNAPANAQIRFPYEDFNKAFVVTLQYQTVDGNVHRLAPIQMTADQSGTQAGAGYDTRYSYVEVPKYLPFLVQNDFNTNATSWQVIQVNGVSVKTRVIWRDNDSVTDPWRVQDIDSYLTQTR